MAKTAQDIMLLIQEHGIKMVDFKIVDINTVFVNADMLAELIVAAVFAVHNNVNEN